MKIFRKAALPLQITAVFWALAALSPAVFPLKFQAFMPPPALHLILFIGVCLFGSVALSLFLIGLGGFVLSSLSSAGGFLVAVFLTGLYGLLLAAKGFFHCKKREGFTATVFAGVFLFSLFSSLFHGGGLDRFFWIPCLLSAGLTAAFAFPLFPLIRNRLSKIRTES